MTALHIDPTKLPKNEKLILRPRMKALSGGAEISVSQAGESVQFTARAQFGMLLFKNAFDFEAKSSWKNGAHGWKLEHYKETNKKTGDGRSAEMGVAKAREKFINEPILDPLALLFAMQSDPMRGPGDTRVGFAARGDHALKVEIFAKERAERVLKAFGAAPRGLLRLELIIENTKNQLRVPAFQDGRASLWIDQQSNKLAEISYTIPPLGSLTLALEQIS